MNNFCTLEYPLLQEKYQNQERRKEKQFCQYFARILNGSCLLEVLRVKIAIKGDL
jgi:hypothetical protein